MNILVTGGAGFIGSNLVSFLIDNEYQRIKVIDNLETGKYENLESIIKHIEFYEGDICDPVFIQSIINDIDIIFHQAAIPSVPRSINDPMKTNMANINGTLNVLIAARDSNVKRVVYASSSSIYGDSPTLPKLENMPVNPLSPYALSKYTGERYCQLFYRIYGLETICLRYFNVFGPNQDPGSEYAAVIPKFISSIIEDRPITIYGNGEQTRDFTYIDNIINANLLAASTHKGIGEVFNIACGERISINELADFLVEEIGETVEFVYTEEKKGEVKHSLADISKARGVLGYEPKVKIWDGLRQSLSWYIKKYERKS